jgi:ATP-dependent DNA helicase RecQ
VGREAQPLPARARSIGARAARHGGYGALKEWRRQRASADGVPAYVVFHDRTLAEIAERRPATADELADIPGVGPAKLERYAREVLAALSGARSRLRG